ncbi:hypothetical protein [Kitasatospora sp. NPDC059327]|uniref:hypothetical protein n=1 Tax=Kitasatospora sp. NPDC059327 TaxID=3346803 RepID=UPI00368413F8
MTGRASTLALDGRGLDGGLYQRIDQWVLDAGRDAPPADRARVERLRRWLTV